MRAVWRSVGVGVCVLALTGCVTVESRPHGEPTVIDMISPTPGTAPMPTDRAGLERELAAIASTLSDARTETESRPGCLRLSALARGFLAKEDQARVGMQRIEYVQLKGLTLVCARDPREVSEDLQGLLADAHRWPD